MVVRGKSVYLLLTEHNSDDLCLLYLEEGGRKLVKRLKLEDVYKIYLFPTASDLGFHGDAVFVVWVNWGGNLTLTRFDPVSGERKDEVLHEEVTGNCQLSMKIIGNTLLVAYQVINKENSRSSVEWSFRKI